MAVHLASQEQERPPQLRHCSVQYYTTGIGLFINVAPVSHSALFTTAHSCTMRLALGAHHRAPAYSVFKPLKTQSVRHYTVLSKVACGGSRFSGPHISRGMVLAHGSSKDDSAAPPDEAAHGDEQSTRGVNMVELEVASSSGRDPTTSSADALPPSPRPSLLQRIAISFAGFFAGKCLGGFTSRGFVVI